MKLFSRSGSKWRIEDKAEGYLNEIVKINPSSAGALLELGNIMLTRGKRREAMEFYQRALAQVKESAWLPERLSRQISLLSSNEPLPNILRLRFVLEYDFVGNSGTVPGFSRGHRKQKKPGSHFPFENLDSSSSVIPC